MSQAQLANATLNLAKMFGGSVVRQVKRRRSRRRQANKWVLGSRMMGYGFNPNSTPRGRRRARRNGRNGGYGSLTTRGVNTTVSQPMTYGNVMRRVVAPMAHTEVGNEELCTINNSPVKDGDFFAASFTINPMEEVTFARLQLLASQYQRYTFQSVEFSYTPFKGTTQTGEIAFAMSPDPTTSVPANMQDLMGLYGAVRGQVNLPFTFSVPFQMFSKALNQYMLKQPTTPYPADDSVINSVGRVYIGIQNVTGGVNIPLGRVSISYRLTLNGPKLDSNANQTSGTYRFPAYASGEPWALEDATDAQLRKDVHALLQNDDSGDLILPRFRFAYLLIVHATANAMNPMALAVVDGNDDPYVPIKSIDDGLTPNSVMAVYRMNSGAQFAVSATETTASSSITVVPCSHAMDLS